MTRDEILESNPGKRLTLARRLRREIFIFLGFLILTAVMTWPWVRHLRDGVKDENDSYVFSYLLWWDYHQTFHDPLHLYQATIFYPYHDTLAFGESGYGVALLFFPLFALGLRPLTVQCIAAFLSFPFTGYCMFRLARTLSASKPIAWVAGIVFAFLPCRFQYLSMVPTIFTGWIPLLFEAVVLFVRERSWKRASWLGVAFVMNVLTSLTWFILTLIPLALTAIIVVALHRAWRDRTFWLRAATTLSAACLVLLPFLLPFYRVSRAWHFVRTPAEVQVFSAHLINWVAVDQSNRLWKNLGAAAADPEMVLFPGLLPPLLALGALFLIAPVRTNVRNLFKRIRSGPYFELSVYGFVWIVIGFMGSFGMNLFFHRALFNFVPLFRSLRVASRWAMICYVGLALLAGLGALRLAKLLNRQWPRLPVSLICAALAIAILFEQRVAPLPLIRGEPDPDQLTLYLKNKKVSGGIVDLPPGRHRYLLRAADHGHPFVSATNSFSPPLERQIETLTMSQPIPDQFLDLLETIPASYLAIHSSFVSPERRVELESFLRRGVATRRLRFVKSFQDRLRSGILETNDLYAVVKTEPAAQSEGPQPPPFSFAGLEPLFSGLVTNFEERSFFVYRLYKISYGRAPLFAEFMPGVQSFKHDPANGTDRLAESQVLFIEAWVKQPEFKSIYDSLNGEGYVDALLAHAGLTSSEAQREALIRGLREGTLTRAAVLQLLVDNDLFGAREFNTAFVLMHYFAYFQRDPDDAGAHFWLYKLNHDMEHRHFTEAFAASTERQLKIEQK
jgi:hypothetical protein